MSRPVRTCLGCRVRGGKHELLRIVAGNGGVVLDPRQIEPGRGAYLHPDPSCLTQAVRRRAFGRALRMELEAGAAEAALRRHLDTLA